MAEPTAEHRIEIKGTLEPYTAGPAEAVLWSIHEDGLPGAEGVHPLLNSDFLTVYGEKGIVLWRGIVDLDFVRPPVRERRGSGTVLGDLLRDFVPFENVLQRRDPHVELFGDAEELKDLVGAIAVRMDESLAIQDLDDGLELVVFPRRNTAGIRRV